MADPNQSSLLDFPTRSYN